MAHRGGTVLDAIHNEMRNKKLLIAHSDSDRDEIHHRKDERSKKKSMPKLNPMNGVKGKMARNQSNEGSMTSGVHSACEHEIAGGGSEDSRSSTSPIDHFVTNNPRRSKVKRVEMKQQQHGSCYVSSTSGEEEEVDIGTMNDNELVFMTEQLSRLRTKEKKQKIAEARLTVTEAKLMEFAAKLAARKSKVEENHGRLKNRKNRIREKEEKIRELEQELNNLDDEVKRRSDILREKEKTLKQSESIVQDQESDIKMREVVVSEQLISIEQRQKIIERKENMIREMSQLLLNQEMSSTRELNFHTRRFNRCHDDGQRRHASDEEIYDTFQRSRSAADLSEQGELWVADVKCDQRAMAIDHQMVDHHLPQPKKSKNGLQRMFANMKKAKSMEKLNSGDGFVHRDIDCNSAENSSGGSDKLVAKLDHIDKPKKKHKIKSSSGSDGPEPPARNQSIDYKTVDYKPAPLLHHPKMIQQMHHQNIQAHQDASIKFLPHIAQFNNPQFLLNQQQQQEHLSAFQHCQGQPLNDSQNPKSVSWQEESFGGMKRRPTTTTAPDRDRRSNDRKRDDQKKMCASQEYLI